MRDRERDKERDSDRRSRSRSRERPRIFVPRYVPGVSASSGGPPGLGRQSHRDCRVYVGNLPYEVKWHHLKDFMREAGDVIFADILVQQNGMSKGCGVVEYRTPEDAQRAIRKLNDTLFMGRPVFIREDRESEAKFGGVGANRPVSGRQVYVGNLPYAVGWQELKDMFRSAGSVVRADVLLDHARRSKGSGTVLFETSQEAMNAISMYDGYEWNGRRIEVREDRYAGMSGPSLGPSPRPSLGARGAGWSSSGRGPTPGGFGGHSSFGAASGHGGAGQFGGSGSGPSGGAGRPGMMDYSGSGYGAGGYGSGQYGQQASGYDSTQASGYGYNGPVAQASGPGEVAGSQIFVNNLPFTTTWQDLIDLFRSCGNIIRSEVLEQNGRPKGSGVVRFDSYDAAERAVTKFNGYLYGGRNLDVHFDRYAT
ncbi:hypothetical protein BC937DRAFT_91478 [Endogone sp. FLAS-F59071]|nr:hypothetical protein BC937DRAFT_91478 [Endogone sp. FLAS-F59071]|eukprot:RUS21780.1 hypothetical protein BC937DRAFT_91478 [Endogone sp. FLAS-F59071]